MDNKEQGINSGVQQTESVSYSEEAKNSHIDMNPPQIVEPLTGSSVIVEPEVKGAVPDNGFPVGYGPNEHMKKIEKPKKPSLGERLKHARQKMTKKQKVLLVTVPLGVVALVGGFITYASITGVFKTDYSGTYLAAKELRNEMQKLRSDANCDKVVEYVSNQYTANETYNDYINGCREVAEGVSDSVMLKVGDTAGVLKDEEVRRRYETLKSALAAAKSENGDVNDVLKKYSIWHEWIKEEASGDTKFNEGWADVDMKKAAAILIDSGVDEFKKYGEEWYKFKKEAADATNLYYHHDTSMLLNELKIVMDEKQSAFRQFKKENEPDIMEVFPLELVDTAKLYAKFEEFYDYVKETYQKNYNPAIGGCKEYVTSVVCE